MTNVSWIEFHGVCFEFHAVYVFLRSVLTPKTKSLSSLVLEVLGIYIPSHESRSGGASFPLGFRIRVKPASSRRRIVLTFSSTQRQYTQPKLCLHPQIRYHRCRANSRIQHTIHFGDETTFGVEYTFSLQRTLKLPIEVKI